MEKVLIDKTEICKYIIDYGNGISCDYVMTDGVLTYYNFYNDQFKKMRFVDDDTLCELKLLHWSKHHEWSSKNLFKLESELENFTDFDKLYYIGGGSDGMLFSVDGTPISTPFYLDDTFFQCYLKVETTEEKCQAILDSLNKEWILESKIVYIPHYNHNLGKRDYDEDEDDDFMYDTRDSHNTLSLLVKLPDDIYIQVLDGKKSWFDTENMKTFALLKL